MVRLETVLNLRWSLLRCECTGSGGETGGLGGSRSANVESDPTDSVGEPGRMVDSCADAGTDPTGEAGRLAGSCADAGTEPAEEAGRLVDSVADEESGTASFSSFSFSTSSVGGDKELLSAVVVAFAAGATGVYAGGCSSASIVGVAFRSISNQVESRLLNIV